MKINPFRVIKKDLVLLSQIIIDTGTQIDSIGQVSNERAVKRILKKYGLRKKDQPIYRATI